MAADAADLPASLEALRTFMERAAELREREPAVAYTCRLWVAHSARELSLNAEAQGWLKHLHAELAAEHAQLPPNVDLRAASESFATRLLGAAAASDRPGCAEMRVAQAWYVASVVLDACKQFGPLPEHLADRQLYARARFQDIKRCASVAQHAPAPHAAPSAPEARHTPHAPTAQQYSCGDGVLHTQPDGACVPATVVGVHLDDGEPYYTIKYADGVERGTVATRLAPLRDGDAEQQASGAAVASGVLPATGEHAQPQQPPPPAPPAQPAHPAPVLPPALSGPGSPALSPAPGPPPAAPAPLVTSAPMPPSPIPPSHGVALAPHEPAPTVLEPAGFTAAAGPPGVPLFAAPHVGSPATSAPVQPVAGAGSGGLAHTTAHGGGAGAMAAARSRARMRSNGGLAMPPEAAPGPQQGNDGLSVPPTGMPPPSSAPHVPAACTVQPAASGCGHPHAPSAPVCVPSAQASVLAAFNPCASPMAALPPASATAPNAAGPTAGPGLTHPLPPQGIPGPPHVPSHAHLPLPEAQHGAAARHQPPGGPQPGQNTAPAGTGGAPGAWPPPSAPSLQPPSSPSTGLPPPAAPTPGAPPTAPSIAPQGPAAPTPTPEGAPPKPLALEQLDDHLKYLYAVFDAQHASQLAVNALQFGDAPRAIECIQQALSLLRPLT